MFSIPAMVTPSCTDPHGKMKLFAALQLMQDCSEMSKDYDTPYRDWLESAGAVQLLNSRQVDVLRVPGLYEKLTCRTRVYAIQGSFGYRNTYILDEQGLPCYMSWSIGAFVNPATGRLCKMPESVADVLKLRAPQMEMEYRSRKITPPDAPENTLPAIPVQRNDIDYNRHVNNAQYIRMGLELLPDDFPQPTGLRVDYRKPVLPGTVLTPTLSVAGGTACIRLKVQDSLHCTMEFTA